MPKLYGLVCIFAGANVGAVFSSLYWTRKSCRDIENNYEEKKKYVEEIRNIYEKKLKQEYLEGYKLGYRRSTAYANINLDHLIKPSDSKFLSTFYIDDSVSIAKFTKEEFKLVSLIPVDMDTL
jgi:hypothetical protein